MKQNYFTSKQSRQINKIYNEVQSYMPFEEATFPAFISKIIPFVREFPATRKAVRSTQKNCL